MIKVIEVTIPDHPEIESYSFYVDNTWVFSGDYEETEQFLEDFFPDEEAEWS